MMSRHFGLSSELTGAITKRPPHAKNQLSAPGSFFNQFVTDIYIYGEFHVKKPIISPPSTDWSEICCVTGHVYVFTFVKISDQSVMWFLSYDVTNFGIFAVLTKDFHNGKIPSHFKLE